MRTSLQLSTTIPFDASIVASLTNKYDAARAFLQTQDWYKCLPPEAQERVRQRCLSFNAVKGQRVLAEGDLVDGWYAVLRGMVKLESRGEDKASTFLGIPEGEWFGEGTALKAEPRRYDVIALRDSVLIRLPLDEFERLKASSLQFNHFLVAHLNRRLGQAMSIIEAQRIRSPEQRVAMYLGSNFWGATRHLSLTQEELGHLSGLSRQTVNKVLRGFQDQRWVSLEFAQIRVLQPQALADLGHNRRPDDISA